MPTQDLNLRTAATTTIANVLGLLPPDIISVANSVTAIHKMIYGTNADARPIAHKTQQPPADEKPIYILNYKDAGVSTHSAAFYDGERVDFYPQNVADGDFGIVDLAQMIIFNQKTENTFRKNSNDPGEGNIECYAIYPSQLGISPPPTPEKIKEIMQSIKNADDYQLYSNNCADQVIKIFERLGVNMDSTKGNPSIPANVLNFSKANGYPVPHNQIPFYQNSEDLGQYLRTQRLNAEARINLSQTNRSVAVPDNCRIANREAERTRHHQNQNTEQVTPVPTNNNSR